MYEYTDGFWFLSMGLACSVSRRHAVKIKLVDSCELLRTVPGTNRNTDDEK